MIVVHNIYIINHLSYDELPFQGEVVIYYTGDIYYGGNSIENYNPDTDIKLECDCDYPDIKSFTYKIPQNQH